MQIRNGNASTLFRSLGVCESTRPQGSYIEFATYSSGAVSQWLDVPIDMATAWLIYRAHSCRCSKTQNTTWKIKQSQYIRKAEVANHPVLLIELTALALYVNSKHKYIYIWSYWKTVGPPVYYFPCPAPLIMLRRPRCFRVYMWAFTVGIDMSGGRLISTRSHSYSPTSHDLWVARKFLIKTCWWKIRRQFPSSSSSSSSFFIFLSRSSPSYFSLTILFSPFFCPHICFLYSQYLSCCIYMSLNFVLNFFRLSPF